MSPAPLDKSHAGSMMSTPARLNGIAAIHATALFLQGLLLARLLDLGSGDTLQLLGAFTLAGALLALVWRCWLTMPHWLDMSFGMLGVGSLGMYFGIWSDHQFLALADLDLRFWTYGCMLFACNLAMIALSHHAHHHLGMNAGSLSMLIGGNIGMVVGMQLGKRAVELFPMPPAPFEMLRGLLGMSFGMVVGMLLGYLAMLGLWRSARAGTASDL